LPKRSASSWASWRRAALRMHTRTATRNRSRASPRRPSPPVRRRPGPCSRRACGLAADFCSSESRRALHRHFAYFFLKIVHEQFEHPQLQQTEREGQAGRQVGLCALWRVERGRCAQAAGRWGSAAAGAARSAVARATDADARRRPGRPRI